MTQQDRQEFALYCKQATDAQLRNIYEHEKKHHRRAYAQLAREEMLRRGVE